MSNGCSGVPTAGPADVPATPSAERRRRPVRGTWWQRVLVVLAFFVGTGALLAAWGDAANADVETTGEALCIDGEPLPPPDGDTAAALENDAPVDGQVTDGAPPPVCDPPPPAPDQVPPPPDPTTAPPLPVPGDGSLATPLDTAVPPDPVEVEVEVVDPAVAAPPTGEVVALTADAVIPVSPVIVDPAVLAAPLTGDAALGMVTTTEMMPVAPLPTAIAGPPPVCSSPEESSVGAARTIGPVLVGSVARPRAPSPVGESEDPEAIPATLAVPGGGLPSLPLPVPQAPPAPLAPLPVPPSAAHASAQVGCSAGYDSHRDSPYAALSSDLSIELALMSQRPAAGLGGAAVGGADDPGAHPG